ncbi:hypothetical protein AnigIFM63604_003307 [Aspergillus niger]|uniref:Uncharacterized protein n=1 Tax=Aspergillus niger TaxID=5061 RepID=A0A9W6EEF9_ASPNG|nr:hypothetical protein AnigIFM63604_003307 [Aspergillus niger]
MAPPPPWTFCCDVAGSEAKKELTRDIQHLLQNGITKDFALMSTNNALCEFYNTPSPCRPHAGKCDVSLSKYVLKAQPEFPSAVWTTHQPSEGLSRRDHNMALVCDIIAGVLSNDERVWHHIKAVTDDNKWRRKEEQRCGAAITRALRFKHNSYVTDFARALGVAAERELLGGSIRIHTGPPFVEVTCEGNLESKSALWLDFMTALVRPPEMIEDKESETVPSVGNPILLNP